MRPHLPHSPIARWPISVERRRHCSTDLVRGLSRCGVVQTGYLVATAGSSSPTDALVRSPHRSPDGGRNRVSMRVSGGAKGAKGTWGRRASTPVMQTDRGVRRRMPARSLTSLLVGMV